MRLIGSVVLGYLAMALAVMVGLTVAYIALGPDRAFEPGAWDVSTVWIVLHIVVGFAAAVLGGWLARLVARGPGGPRVLASVVVVLGLALALAALLGDAAAVPARTGDVGAFEAMQVAQTPLWIMLLNPVVGALGVLLGGGALGRVFSGAPRGATAHRA